MKIYYGRFLKATELMVEGGYYYHYFDSKENAIAYVDQLREMGSDDILEAVGEMEFNKRGRLVIKDGTEELLYDPEDTGKSIIEKKVTHKSWFEI